LSGDEVERLIKEAESHAEEDAKRREVVETRNSADNAAYQAEKSLAEHGDKITPELKQEITDQIASLRLLLAQDPPSEDTASMQASLETLMASLSQIGQQVYEQQQAEEASSEPPSNDDTDTPPVDDTVEGEFREV
jgi:molecular chaperone DnaK